jgi:hypothetical protein
MTVCARSHRDFAPIDTALRLLVRLLARSGLGGLAARVEFKVLPEAAQVGMLGAQAPLRVRDIPCQSATF